MNRYIFKESTMKHQPKNLELWSMPSNYVGEVWPCYYVFLSQNRESDSLTRSNFTCALQAIGGESETVHVIRERHCAVGWVEWIAIHQDDTDALQAADAIAAKLQDYPVVNEDHWGELEWNEAQEYWSSLRLSERVELCQDAGVSVFSARHAWIPQDDSCYIFEHCRG